MKRNVMMCVIALLLCIATTIALRIVADRASIDYDERKVTVISSEAVQKKMLRSQRTVYEVMVSYRGEEYELRNAQASYAYPPGRQVTAFMSGDKLYANVEGIRTSSPLFIAYFVFLFVSFGMVILTAITIVRARQSASTDF